MMSKSDVASCPAVRAEFSEGEEMSEWKETTLGDILEIKYGKDHKALNDGNYPCLGSGGIMRFVDSFLYDDESILIPRKGTLNNIIYQNSPFWTVDTMFWSVINKSKVLPKYLFYQLTLIDFNNLNVGSAVPSLTVPVISQIEITLPPLPKQKAIAQVLSSLDDKIDLLHRQNKTLEAIAEDLFRQWFIEEAQEDWEEVCLEDITQRITDGSHYSPPTTEEGMPMASVKDMYDWGINKDTCRRISYEDYKKLVDADCRPLTNDILIAKDGSYLKHVFVVEQDLDIVILSSIAILRPNFKMHPILLALFLKQPSTLDQLENIVTGAVIPRIVLKDFRKFQLLLPPKNIQERAVSSIVPLYRKCWGNNKQIRTLEKLRDTLLPKLMSGEVRVAL